MLTYVNLFSWTDQGAKSVKETVTRTEKNQAFIEKMGGRILNIFWTQGNYDLVVISEWPDEDTAMACLLAVASAGYSRSTTLRAFSAEDMGRFIEKMP
jgi:uncharacterized protein with GYD domain